MAGCAGREAGKGLPGSAGSRHEERDRRDGSHGGAARSDSPGVRRRLTNFLMTQLSTPKPPSAERDLQRAALRALVDISERCAAREIEIDAQHASAIEAANK